jgi:hypothetical protein
MMTMMPDSVTVRGPVPMHVRMTAMMFGRLVVVPVRRPALAVPKHLPVTEPAARTHRVLRRVPSAAMGVCCPMNVRRPMRMCRPVMGT